MSQVKIVRHSAHLVELQDSLQNCASLVIGNEKALLFDTMCGIENLADIIHAITSLPLTVVLSHGHFDHIGSLASFPEAFISAPDLEIVRKHMERWFPVISKNLRAQLDNPQSFHFYPGDLSQIKALKPDEGFDLGGITLQSVELPGHTPGSIGLYCEEERFLLSRDAFTNNMCLFFPESMGKRTYQKALQTAIALGAQTFITGHSTELLPISLLNTFYKCSELPDFVAGNRFTYSLVPQWSCRKYVYEWRNPVCHDSVSIIIPSPHK